MKYDVVTPDYLPLARMIKLRESGRPVYDLEETYPYWINGVPFSAKKGLHYDKASTPQIVWIFLPPADPDYDAAVLLHDLVYGGQLLPRKMCDEIMRDTVLCRWKAGVMYAGVRIGGAEPYSRGSKRLIVKRQRIRELLYGPNPGTRVPMFDTWKEMGNV